MHLLVLLLVNWFVVDELYLSVYKGFFKICSEKNKHNFLQYNITGNSSDAGRLDYLLEKLPFASESKF